MSAAYGIDVQPTVEEFKTGYLDSALVDLDGVLETAERVLAETAVDYDTLVGTGFSGALVVPALALRLGKKFVLVRKANDGSHHSGRMIGQLGKRWIFVDDFVSSGTTRKRVRRAVHLSCEERGWSTDHVGDYLYAWSGQFRQTSWYAAEDNDVESEV
jgi:adenine/guanine phosphoribosyltransferase-like PRPP-binding protein